jgi:EAL domain-containing protein (putative c-di-GMP-specific phosphodiesterase class I)
LHHGDVEVGGLGDSLSACASSYDDSGDGILVRSQTVDITTTELSETELAKAVAHAIQKFSETKGEFTIGDLNQGLQDMVATLGPRISEVKKLIKDRAFDLAYQPIVDLAQRQVHHHEALVRFRGKGASSSPYETIAFAEEVGLIPALDLAICKKAIEVVREARSANRRLSLAVNLSGKSLETPVFVQRLHSLLKGAQVIRDHLLFEVTESSKIFDLETTNQVLQSLRELGYKVCLDDFGAGASAFQYLRALSIDYVKIDGSYIRDLAADADKRAFVRSMTTLCRDLHVETIGEMIEDEATAKILRQAGVSYGQGYLFGKPSTERPK